MTVCQYAAPKDKKCEKPAPKRRPVSLVLTPASSCSSVASHQSTEEFWGRYQRRPASPSVLQVVRRLVTAGLSRSLGSLSSLNKVQEPTYAEVYRGQGADKRGGKG